MSAPDLKPEQDEEDLCLAICFINFILHLNMMLITNLNNTQKTCPWPSAIFISDTSFEHDVDQKPVNSSLSCGKGKKQKQCCLCFMEIPMLFIRLTKTCIAFSVSNSSDDPIS